MKKIKILALAVALLTVAFASQASATSFTLINGGGAVSQSYVWSGSPAGVSATISWSLSGNVLTLTVKNTSTYPNVSLSGLSFNTTPDVTATIGAQTGGISGWSSPGGAQGGFEVRAGNAGACSNVGTLCNGETGTISFNLTNFSGNLTIDASTVKLQTNVGSLHPTGTTVPEPASLFLMGTGLVGFGRVVRKRFQK